MSRVFIADMVNHRRRSPGILLNGRTVLGQPDSRAVNIARAGNQFCA